MKFDKRKIVQLTTAILYNCNYLGFKNGNIYTGELKKFCVPGLNCYSCPGAIAACPLGSFQNFIMQRSGSANIFAKIPFYILGLLIIFGVVFGRVVCGFLCPFGFIQEIIYKIKTKKIKKNNITRELTIVKYIILALFVIILPILLFEPSFCKYICPAGTLEAGVTLYLTNDGIKQLAGFLYCWKISVLIAVIGLSIIMYRFFCRFICPLGAIYSFFNKTSILGVKIDLDKCDHCNVCTNTCLMDVKKVGDRECIECGECINKCHKKAIYRAEKKHLNKF